MQHRFDSSSSLDRTNQVSSFTISSEHFILPSNVIHQAQSKPAQRLMQSNGTSRNSNSFPEQKGSTSAGFTSYASHFTLNSLSLGCQDDSLWLMQELRKRVRNISQSFALSQPTDADPADDFYLVDPEPFLCFDVVWQVFKAERKKILPSVRTRFQGVLESQSRYYEVMEKTQLMANTLQDEIAYCQGLKFKRVDLQEQMMKDNYSCSPHFHQANLGVEGLIQESYVTIERLRSNLSTQTQTVTEARELFAATKRLFLIETDPVFLVKYHGAFGRSDPYASEGRTPPGSALSLRFSSDTPFTAYLKDHVRHGSIGDVNNSAQNELHMTRQSQFRPLSQMTQVNPNIVGQPSYSQSVDGAQSDGKQKQKKPVRRSILHKLQKDDGSVASFAATLNSLPGKCYTMKMPSETLHPLQILTPAPESKNVTKTQSVADLSTCASKNSHPAQIEVRPPSQAGLLSHSPQSGGGREILSKRGPNMTTDAASPPNLEQGFKSRKDPDKAARHSDVQYGLLGSVFPISPPESTNPFDETEIECEVCSRDESETFSNIFSDPHQKISGSVVYRDKSLEDTSRFVNRTPLVSATPTGSEHDETRNHNSTSVKVVPLSKAGAGSVQVIVSSKRTQEFIAGGDSPICDIEDRCRKKSKKC